MTTFNLTTLCLGGAIAALRPYLSGWFWVFLLAGAYLLVWILPLVHPSAAERLSDEQLRPKTWLGRNLTHLTLMTGLLLVLGIGAIGVGRSGPIHLGMILAGVSFAIVAIYGGQTFAHQVREKWLKETLARGKDKGDGSIP